MDENKAPVTADSQNISTSINTGIGNPYFISQQEPISQKPEHKRLFKSKLIVVLMLFLIIFTVSIASIFSLHVVEFDRQYLGQLSSSSYFPKYVKTVYGNGNNGSSILMCVIAIDVPCTQPSVEIYFQANKTEKQILTDITSSFKQHGISYINQLPVTIVQDSYVDQSQSGPPFPTAQKGLIQNYTIFYKTNGIVLNCNYLLLSMGVETLNNGKVINSKNASVSCATHTNDTNKYTKWPQPQISNSLVTKEDISKAVRVAQSWANNISKDNFLVAQQYEDDTYKSESINLQTSDLRGLDFSAPSFKVTATKTGLVGDKNKQIVAVDLQPEYATNTKILEVYIQDNNGTWQLWSEKNILTDGKIDIP